MCNCDGFVAGGLRVGLLSLGEPWPPGGHRAGTPGALGQAEHRCMPKVTEQVVKEQQLASTGPSSSCTVRTRIKEDTTFLGAETPPLPGPWPLLSSLGRRQDSGHYSRV